MFSKYKNQTRVARIPTGEAVLGSDIDTLVKPDEMPANEAVNGLGLTAIQASMEIPETVVQNSND